MKKTIPAPSIGRIVLVRLQDEIMPAVVVATTTNHVCRVLPFSHDWKRIDFIASYGEDCDHCWWWPPRVDATIEVDVP